MKVAAVFLRDDFYYLHGRTRSKSGGWVTSGPFHKIERGEKGLYEKVLDTLEATNSRRGTGLEPIIELAGLKSWDEFVRGAKYCNISLANGKFSFFPSVQAKPDYFEYKSDLVVEGKANTDVEMSALVEEAFGRCR